ncbi:hypothetical protein ACQKFS_18540 [Pseudomonas guineae]|uniref:hypothetical protein n=1 Tax=Pseudomonas guineae TaxID=425504 RepID=UPI003D041BF9
MNRNEERIDKIRSGLGSTVRPRQAAPHIRQKAYCDGKKVVVSRQMFLPGFALGAFPNHLNRSSLIAPIARGERKRHMRSKMVTRRDCILEYSGEQLDEADGDLIMALIAFAQPFPLGDPVLLNRKELLRKIKRGAIGSSQYEWLYRSMKRLREATLFLEALKPDGSTRYTVGRMESFNILKSLSYDNETYRYTLDPHWILMFGNREYSLIDWGKRLQIRRGLDMAKTLQRLIATSSDRVQRFALEGLRTQMTYGGRLRDFRNSLGRAVCELERLEIIVRGCIQESSRGKPQLALWLPP